VGRPRGFDEDEVLDRAVEVFRARGWQQTSLDDLVSELGVPRQSLYNTFGDKEDLYHAALARYRAGQSRSFEMLLSEERPIRAVLRDLFAAKVEEVLREPGSWGCLIVNATMERPGDPVSSREVRKGHDAVEAALTARLRRAQQAGEIGAHHDVRALARFLQSALVGLAVVGRGRPDREALEDVARVTLATLG